MPLLERQSVQPFAILNATKAPVREIFKKSALLNRSACAGLLVLLTLSACSSNKPDEVWEYGSYKDSAAHQKVSRPDQVAVRPPKKAVRATAPVVKRAPVAQRTAATPATQVKQSGSQYGQQPVEQVSYQTALDQQSALLQASTPSYSSAEIGRLVQAMIVQRSQTSPVWADVMDRFYQAYGYQPVWFRGSWSPEAKVAYQTLSNSLSDGLPSARYLGTSGLDLASAVTADEVAAIELALTQGMMTFIPELKNGMSKGGFDATQLHSALGSGDFEGWIEKQRPQTALYQGLRRAMQSHTLTQDQMRKVALNLHRARESDEQIHEWRRIRVNIPGFNLQAIEGGNVTGTMKVIVGQPDRPTPVLKDRIINLKFSPDWTVPSVAAREDILPILKKNAKGLVDKMGLQVYRGGRKVAATSVNWNKYTASNLPYTFRQKPGAVNALGGVRFSMTNPHAIFLHDTPEKDLFGESLRSISSGCVRVEDAQALASWMLRDAAGWDHTRVGTAMTSGKTSVKKLSNSIAVDLVYYTASVDQSGNLRFHKDIYSKDAALAAKLGI